VPTLSKSQGFNTWGNHSIWNTVSDLKSNIMTSIFFWNKPQKNTSIRKQAQQTNLYFLINRVWSIPSTLALFWHRTSINVNVNSNSQFLSFLLFLLFYDSHNNSKNINNKRTIIINHMFQVSYKKKVRTLAFQPKKSTTWYELHGGSDPQQAEPTTYRGRRTHRKMLLFTWFLTADKTFD